MLTMTSAAVPPCEDDFVRRVLEIRIGERYQLIRKLGSGTFGLVYEGRDVKTREGVALKLEHDSVWPSFVAEEVNVYQSLTRKAGFPKVFWHGHHETFNIMVLELLGPNLEDLLVYCGGRFSLKTTLMLADQLLSRFEALHAQGYLHRDVKPENFLMGSGRQGNVVYMTDLGLSAFGLNKEPTKRVGIHGELERKTRLLGTCRYASIKGHYDESQSCRDDLEALGYMLVYFIKGQLPWQGLRAETREGRYDQVRQVKEAMSPKDLCTGLPSAFEAYMNYIRSLSGSDKPSYRGLRRSFCDLFKKEGFSYDNVFDWTLLEWKRLQDQKIESANANPSTRAGKRRRGANRRTSKRLKQKRIKSIP